eukprot:4557102-Pleurochrysis_carterae.AAC.1
MSMCRCDLFCCLRLCCAGEHHAKALLLHVPGIAERRHAGSVFWTRPCSCLLAHVCARKRRGPVAYRRCRISLTSQLHATGSAPFGICEHPCIWAKAKTDMDKWVFEKHVHRHGCADNSFGLGGVTALAEVLKFNTSLATLDVSRASGPSCVRALQSRSQMLAAAIYLAGGVAAGLITISNRHGWEGLRPRVWYTLWPGLALAAGERVLVGESACRCGRTDCDLGQRCFAVLAEALKVNTSLTTLNAQCAYDLACSLCTQARSSCVSDKA